jgi:hypothetical protein
MRRLVWIHAGCKCLMLVLSWRGSNKVYGEWSISSFPLQIYDFELSPEEMKLLLDLNKDYRFKTQEA